MKTGADWYNKRRGHSGRDHLPPVRDDDEPPVVYLATHKFICPTELGSHRMAYGAAA